MLKTKPLISPSEILSNKWMNWCRNCSVPIHTRGYKDGLQPETLADGNWLVKQNQPVSKIETKSDTNLRSLYESRFRNALISKSVILWWQAKKGINSELEGANACLQSLKHSFKKVSVSHAQLAHFSTLAKEKHMLLILNFSTLTIITNARTTMPFARLHSQMVCTQSEPAEIPRHMFVQITKKYNIWLCCFERCLGGSLFVDAGWWFQWL